jgi:hypothetical protein
VKILILGGYGLFGSRLAQLLADCAGLSLVIAGRDANKAKAFCDRWQGAAKIQPLCADRARIAPALAGCQPNLLIDASGPFQNYGADPYSVLRACIAAKVNYLDLADGADFVAGASAFDHAARQAGVYALSGVSTCPVLTTAVLREIAKTMQVTRVRGGIAPSPFSGVGENVIRAVLSYAGAPVALYEAGQVTARIGLGDVMHYTVAPPGEVPLHNRLFSFVDVPDLLAIPKAMPEVKSLWFGGGPVPEFLHQMLVFLAKTRAALRLPSMGLLAPLCYHVLNIARFGEHRGGMFIEATGLRDGQSVQRSWHLLAEGDAGPLIPSMACEALVRRCLEGDPPAPGARSGIDALTLADYEARFFGRDIVTGWREVATGPIYQQVLATSFTNLPRSLQELHQPGALAEWRGHCEVQRGDGWLAQLVARVFGFPAKGRDVPVSVQFRTDAQGKETWQRNFGGRIMRSTQEAGQGRWAQLIVERFGPFAFGLALVTRADRLSLIPRRWSFLGLPLPKALMPKGDTYETEVEGQFRFHVEITLPLIGPVVCYKGGLNRA